METTGRIFDIQRFSIHDGPGIRTTVFLKGCPLRCLWCHNPEGISPQPELSFVPDRCVACGACVRACPEGAHRMADGHHVLKRELCRHCGACVEQCPAGALEMAGREASVSEVLSEAVRDRPFYETSGGGVTLSGGEPTMQPEFCLALLRAARAEGLHTCVDTCGYCEWSRLEQMLPLVDLWLFDFKESDTQRHRDYTGVPNGRILENLRRLCASGARLVLRCPIIPGLNDRDDHFEAIRRLAAELGLSRVELLPYHGFGDGKVERFGLSGLRRIKAPTPAPHQVAEWQARTGGVTL